MDQLVKNLHVTTTSNFDERGTPRPATQYSYYIGTHGPFVDSFLEGQDTVENIEAAMQKRIAKLRAIGAV